MSEAEPTWLVTMPRAIERAWVILHPNSSTAYPQFYTTDGTPGAYSWTWTTDPRDALRFARREDARRVAGAKGYLHALLVEYDFPAGG